MKRFNLWLRRGLSDALTQLQHMTGLPKGEIIRRAMKLDHNLKEDQLQLQQQFGKLLRAMRWHRRYTLVDTADSIGVSVALMSAIERGKKPIPLMRQAVSLLRFLEASEQESEALLNLMGSARMSIEFELSPENPSTNSVLLKLADRQERGGLTDEDPIVARLEQCLADAKPASDGERPPPGTPPRSGPSRGGRPCGA